MRIWSNRTEAPPVDWHLVCVRALDGWPLWSRAFKNQWCYPTVWFCHCMSNAPPRRSVRHSEALWHLDWYPRARRGLRRL